LLVLTKNQIAVGEITYQTNCSIVLFPRREIIMTTPQLSNREIEVLNNLFVGKICKEIADTLKVSNHTIKWHCQTIYKKLGVSNSLAAVYKALELGIIEPPTPINRKPKQLSLFN